jgi:hypothetical protein
LHFAVNVRNRNRDRPGVTSPHRHLDALANIRKGRRADHLARAFKPMRPPQSTLAVVPG